MKKIIVYIFSLFFGLSILTQVAIIKAASFSVVGQISFVDNKNVPANNIVINAYRLGDSQIAIGSLNKEADKLSYKVEIADLKKNDQIVVTAEAKSGDENDYKAYFGGVTTVIGDKELQSGLVGQLNIEMLILPLPEFESYDDKMMKVCWRGINDFSIVGYEIFRSEDKLLTGQEIGRSGQSAGKKVCYVDSVLEKNKTYYYSISAITSWNAGEGKEVKVSGVKSAVSDGMKMGIGVVDKKSVTEPIAGSNTESDMSDPEKIQDKVVSEPINQVDNVIQKITIEVKSLMQEYNLSWQYLSLMVMALFLLIVIVFFVLSVQVANVRSHKKDVWRK